MNIKKRKRWDYQRLVIGFIMVLLLILGKPAAAQPPGSSTLRVNVELATVEVSVKNKKGQPIQGLKNENFELLIDGKRQEIVTFDEVREEETVAVRPTSLKDSDEAGPRGKVVLIVFDDHTISLSQLKVTRDAAEIYVKKHMAPQDSFAVAIYGRELQIVQTFTRDPNLVIAAIRKPAASFGQSQLGVGFTGKEGQLMAKNVLRKLISLSSSLGEIKGRKSILFFTEDFGAMAEEETIQLIETARKAKVSFYTLIATRASASAGLRQPSSRSSNPPARVPKTESWSSMLAQLLQRLLPESTLLSSPLVAWMMPQQAQQGGGPPSNLPQGPTGSGIGDSSGRDDFDRIDKGTASGQIMQALAKDTYGDVVRESSDLTKGLDAINLEISNYYVLGYRPANLKVEDKLLKVEVKTTVKDGKLLFAHGTYVSKSAATPEVSAAEKNLSNLMNDKKASGGFPLELRPVVFYDSPQLARVVVFARIKPESVSDSNRLDFMGAAFEEGGTQAGRFLGSLNLGTSPASASHGEILYQNQLLLKPGKYQIKVAVASNAGKSANRALPLEVPPLPETKLGVSSLVVSRRVSPLPELIKDLQLQLLNESNPFAYKGYEISPSIDNQVDRQTPLAVFYKIYNWKKTDPTHVLVAKPRLMDEKGQQHELTPVRLTRVVQPSGARQVTIGYNFSVKDLPPGPYILAVETQDPATNQSAICQTEVLLK